MEIKLNTKFDEILLIVCDKHVIENHEKFFVDKYENVMCVECLYKFLFKKYPLYKKYLLFKSINNLFCIKECEEFRYHFSFYLLDHTLFLSETFSYIEGISQCEEKKEERKIYSSNYNNENIKNNNNNNNNNNSIYDDDDDYYYYDYNYIYLVNSELIKLTTNACKEFLYKCSKELCNIFKDAIYTCVLVRLKNFSSRNKKRNFFFLLDFLKSLIDNVEIIFITLKDESTIIEELMKLFIQNDEMINSKLSNNNYGYIYEYTGYTNKCIEKKKQNNNQHYNSELLLNLQIIYKLWHDNLLWQVNNNLLKRFFIYLITKFKYTNKNTDLCTYYIQFIYLITLQYNVLNYFFHHIIFDSSPNSNIKAFNIENNNRNKSKSKSKSSNKSKNSSSNKSKNSSSNKSKSSSSNKSKSSSSNNNLYSVIIESNHINTSNTNSSNNNSVEHNSNYCHTSSTCITKIKTKNTLDPNILSIYNSEQENKKNEFTKEQKKINRCFQTNIYPEDIEDYQDVKDENSIQENEEKYKQICEVNKTPNEYMNRHVKKIFYYHDKEEYNSPTSNNSSIKSNIFFIPEHDLIYSDDEKNVTHYPLKKKDISNLGEYEMESVLYNNDNMSIRSEGTLKNKFSSHEKFLNVSKFSTESKYTILSRLSNHFSFTKNSVLKEKDNFVFSNCDNTNDNVSCVESSHTSYSLSNIDEKKKKKRKKKKINFNKLEILENSHIFIILCDNLQETLLNHFNSDIQMKCLDIFYTFCSFDDNIVNIILTNTSLVEWVFDYISNTKYENLREKALKLLVTFFFNNTLFSNTHTHYAIDVLINIIMRYVNKDNITLSNKVIYNNDMNNKLVHKQFMNNNSKNTVYNNNSYDHYSNKFKNNFFTISYIIKALNMLINISHASIKISHIFKIINIFSCLIKSPSCAPTSIDDIILLFESILLKNNNNYEISYGGKLEESICTQEDDSIFCKLKSKEKNEQVNKILHMNEECNIYINTFNGIQKIKQDNFLHKKKKNITIKKNNITKSDYKVNNNDKGDPIAATLGNNLLNDIINKVYITNIFILFKILKTALNIIKTVNIYKKDIYIEIIYNEDKNYIQNITISIMKLLFCLVYILNRNEEFFIDLNIINENDKLDNENNFESIAFIKLMLSFFIELDIFMENIYLQNSNIINQEKKLYNIQFLYLTCIFIIHNIYEKRQIFNNVSWNILFSSFFNHFYNLLARVLYHVDHITETYLKGCEQINKSENFINIDNRNNETIIMSMSPKRDGSKEDEQKKEKINNHHNNDNNNNDNNNNNNNISINEQHKLIVDKFVIYKKRMRKELLSNRPFTLFFQYVSRKNYSEECHRILKLLIDEEETIIHQRDDLKDILIDIIKKNDFYFSNVLLFNFNDNEVIIETVIYIFYLSLKYDKGFLEKKLNKSKKINYVQHLFVNNNYNNNINPLFIFMSLTYSYYFIKKDKIYIAFQHIQNQLFKINLYLWKDIKKLKNIYLAFDCIFSLKVDNNNYNHFFPFIIYIIKLELSLYASGEISEVDNKLYLSISKNRELVNMIFEHIEMDNILSDQIIYIYYLIIKLRKYSVTSCNKNISLYKMMNTVIRYMNTVENKTDEINNIFSFFFLFFENLEKYSEKDIFNIITLLQKLSLYVKYSLEKFFSTQKIYENNDNNSNDNNNNCYSINDENKMEYSNNHNNNNKNNNDIIYNILKFENSFFYFLLNLIFYCRKYNQIQNINVLSSSISLIHLLIYSIKNTNTHFRSLSFYILSLLILPFPKSPQNTSPLLIKLCTSFDKNIEEILSLHNNTSNTNQENKSDKCIVRKNLFYPLLTHESMEIRLSSLSLLLCLLLTNEWDNIQNDLLLATINVLLLSTNINLKVKSFCFNYIYSFRPFFLRCILHLNRKQEVIIHRLFFLLMVVKIKPLWFDITTCSEKILKIIMNVVTRKNMDLFIFNCIISVAHETFIKEKKNYVNNNYNNYTNKENKNVIENLEEYLETYKKNIKKNSDMDIYNISSFNKFKCENINYYVVLSVLNTTTILLYK
ncbi:conserved Plasmodium protein, unknown function [Plasmodium sp. gorilla clade G1]|nr:conserved Plasmodium protein, unknown function [Plasmodium sp. gorilla clade G1]